MKAKYSFEFMDLDDGLVAVPVGNNNGEFHGVLKLNETAAFILKLLDNETSETEIVDALLKEYNGDKEEISKYIHQFIEKLISENVVE